MLLIGDGDLQLAEFMANVFGKNNHNITTTTLEKEGELTEMYPFVGSRIQRIKEMGGRFFPDGTKLKTCMAPYLINPRNVDQFVYPKVQKLFDRVLFMFPFGGKVYNEKTPWKTEIHSKLLQDFFESAKTLLEKDGQIHVTMNTSLPYQRWSIGAMADSAGLKEVGMEDFDVKKFLLYMPKKGCGSDANTEITLSKPCTFMYGLE